MIMQFAAHHTHLAKPGRGRRGSALIIVLMISLGLVAVTLYFADTMIMEYQASENAAASLEADQACEGASRYLIYLLKNLEKPGQMPDDTTYAREAVRVGDNTNKLCAKFWLIGRDPAIVQSLQQQEASDTPYFGLISESGKLNINTVTSEVLSQLPLLYNDETIAYSITDWRDADDASDNGGAESEVYLGNNPPYNAKNANYESPEELRLIYDVDYQLLYGEDANRNGILDPNETDGTLSPPEDNQDGKLDFGLIEYVTPWSREPNKAADGTARVNYADTNASSQLTQMLTDKLGETRSQQIVTNLGTMTSIRSNLEFFIKSQMSTDEFAQIEDYIAPVSTEFIKGKINVNTASEEVLSCIPGIGTDYAATIINSRKGKTPDDLASIGWVAQALNNDATIAAQAGPYLTTRTYQYAADVVAVGHGGRGMRRVLFVIDTADGGTPRIIYRRDLTHLGWPLGSSIRDELRQEAQLN